MQVFPISLLALLCNGKHDGGIDWEAIRVLVVSFSGNVPLIGFCVRNRRLTAMGGGRKRSDTILECLHRKATMKASDHYANILTMAIEDGHSCGWARTWGKNKDRGDFMLFVDEEALNLRASDLYLNENSPLDGFCYVPQSLFLEDSLVPLQRFLRNCGIVGIESAVRPYLEHIFKKDLSTLFRRNRGRNIVNVQ